MSTPNKTNDLIEMLSEMLAGKAEAKAKTAMAVRTVWPDLTPCGAPTGGPVLWVIREGIMMSIPVPNTDGTISHYTFIRGANHLSPTTDVDAWRKDPFFAAHARSGNFCLYAAGEKVRVGRDEREAAAAGLPLMKIPAVPTAEAVEAFVKELEERLRYLDPAPAAYCRKKIEFARAAAQRHQDAQATQAGAPEGRVEYIAGAQ
jgi:hypothetical protein